MQEFSCDKEKVGTYLLETLLSVPPHTELPLSSLPAFIKLLPHSSAHEPLNQNTRPLHKTLYKAPSQRCHFNATTGPSENNAPRCFIAATFCL